MSDPHSFIDRVLAGQARVAEIDDFVDAWHRGQSDRDLHDFLGMKPSDYSLWLDQPDMLALICEARRDRQPLAQAVGENMRRLRDGAKLARLEAWLRRQGVAA